METIWFTSDTHYGHKRMITERGVRDVPLMDELLIRNWNDVVGKSDRVYHLGDFSFHKLPETVNILRRLNGQLHVVLGNHDRDFWKKIPGTPGTRIASVTEARKEIKVGEQKIVLDHYALLTWNKMHYGSWMLHGHSHGNLPDSKTAKRLDVGVDAVGWYALTYQVDVPRFTPISFEQVSAIMRQKKFEPVDQHGTRVGYDGEAS
jgi:calcineurin-like phosphoesterase family protein